MNYLWEIFTIISDLCGLCVFAGDIPILLVAALPR